MGKSLPYRTCPGAAKARSEGSDAGPRRTRCRSRSAAARPGGPRERCPDAAGRRPRSGARRTAGSRPRVQLGPERLELRVSEVAPVGVGQDHHAVGTQLVQGVGGFGERSVHVRQGEDGEVAEPVGPVLHQLCGELVHVPGRGAGSLQVVRSPERSGVREDAGGDRAAVHHRDRAPPVPGRYRPAEGSGPVGDRAAAVGRDHMVVDVDACVFVHAGPRLLPPVSGAAGAWWTGTRRAERRP